MRLKRQVADRKKAPGFGKSFDLHHGSCLKVHGVLVETVQMQTSTLW